MHLCYLSDERFPSTHTDTQQMVLTMDALARDGVDVELVAPRMPMANQEAELRAYYGVGDSFGVRLVPTVDPARRALVKTAHPLAALWGLNPSSVDVVYTRNAQIALLALGLGHRVAFESYRVIDRRLPSVVKLVARAARHERFVGAVVHSEVSAAAFRRVGVPAAKVRVVYNGYAPEQFEPVLTRDQAREQLGLPRNQPLAVFAGHVRAHKGLESLARIAAQTVEVRHVWVGGDNDGAPEWGMRCAAEAGAHNVTVTGWLQARAVAPYLYAADVAMIPPASTPLTEHGNTVLPLKLFGYLASGCAIVAPALPDLSELLRHDDNAMLVEPDDIDGAVAAVRRLVSDDELRARLGSAARTTIEDMTWARRAQKIRAFLEERLAL
jgi:glycosyltransferase involved in cell wall biosynthesis